jgi:hypothetical protein
MNELATIDKAEQQRLAAILGTSTRSDSGDRLPMLKISSKRKDAQGRKIDQFQGHFFVTDMEENVYASNVKIRVLSQLFQWIHFDPEVEKVVNKTLLIPNFRHEARDMKGGIRCGKPASKVFKELSKEEQKKYVDIKCYRQLRVLVSYTGTTVDGDEVTIENQPAIILLKGSNFNPFEDEFLNSIPKGRQFHDYWCDVTTKEHENGSVVYYTMHFEGNFGEPVALDQQTYDTMIHFARLVQEENDRIERSHEDSMRKSSTDEQAIDALEGEYEEDFEDEVVD